MGSSKTALTTGRQVAALLGASRKQIIEYTIEDKGQCVLFALLSVTKPLLYGSPFDFVAVQLSLKSRRQQSALQRHFALD